MAKSKRLLLFFMLTICLNSTFLNHMLVSGADTATITIQENGIIEPTIAQIEHLGTDYKLTEDITNLNLRIQASNITIDGANHTIYGEIKLNGNHITIKNTQINSGGLGILVNGNHCLIQSNIFSHNLADISTIGDYNTINDNTIPWGAYCTFYIGSNNNIVTENYLKGIEVSGSNNIIADNTLDYLSKGGENNTYYDNTLNAYNAITPTPTESTTIPEPTATATPINTAPPTTDVTSNNLLITTIVVAGICICLVCMWYLRSKKNNKKYKKSQA